MLILALAVKDLKWFHRKGTEEKSVKFNIFPIFNKNKYFLV